MKPDDPTAVALLEASAKQMLASRGSGATQPPQVRRWNICVVSVFTSSRVLCSVRCFYLNCCVGIMMRCRTVVVEHVVARFGKVRCAIV